MKLAVFGSTGGTGRLILAEAAAYASVLVDYAEARNHVRQVVNVTG